MKGKSLGLFGLIMINIIAVDSLRSLPFSAEFGFSLTFFYLLGLLAFMLPTALIAAELATGWPSRGGVYIWVREAFGHRAGFIAIWMQWIYNVVWYPTILSFIAGTLAYMIEPSLAENRLYMWTLNLAMFWGLTLLNLYGMRLSSLFSSSAAILGTLLPITLIILLVSFYLLSGKPSQISFSVESFFPELTSFKNMSFFVAILFGLIGMEMSAVHADEVSYPEKNYPKAIFISAIIIFLSLVLSSLAIAVVVPSDELNILTGLVQGFYLFLDAFQLQNLKPLIDLLIIIGGLGTVGAWIIGPTKGLQTAAIDGHLPKMFKRVNAKNVPSMTLLFQGLIFTLLTSLFWLLPTVSDSYWILTAMTAQLAMIYYIGLFSAGIRLRYRHSQVKRHYRIPFGNRGMWIMACLGILTALFAIVLGFMPPEELKMRSPLRYEFILSLGLLLLISPAFLLGKRAGKRPTGK